MDSTSFKVEVDVLRPTQLCVGIREVAEKRKELEHESKDQRHNYLQAHAVPVVRAPDGGLYLIDHHHLARALHDAGFMHASASLVADFSALDWPAFWHHLEQKQWVYLADTNGHSRSVAELPKHVAALHDDPYRSLAGFARKAGAFAKDAAPFAEFHWAEFFRASISLGDGDAGFEHALKQATALAQTPAASKLPGFLPTMAGLTPNRPAGVK